MTKQQQRKLVELGRAVLQILEEHIEWDADTTDAIANEAFKLNLADTKDSDGTFR